MVGKTDNESLRGPERVGTMASIVYPGCINLLASQPRIMQAAAANPGWGPFLGFIMFGFSCVRVPPLYRPFLS